VLPLLQIRDDAHLNVERAEHVLGRCSRPSSVRTAPPRGLRRLWLQGSFGDGTTWIGVPVRDGTRGWGASSLRAEDVRGNAVSQKVIRAYELH